ncbi:SH3 domain protein [Ancylostoma caninum]|uniref:SH3 domain protein n=1 Tax=Ancylostoma caninum TaxID=29170 RepID=A0A368G5A7_ANCCA|nr:SH3 domain protein [Ancylostoma caninum]
MMKVLRYLGKQFLADVAISMLQVADELSVQKGTKVKAIYREDDWIYVHASGGKRGFVPQAYCRLNVESPDAKFPVIQHKLSKTTARVQRRSSRKEQEKTSRTTTNRYLHKDIHKSSLERFLDSLPVKKDEGQPFHTHRCSHYFTNLSKNGGRTVALRILFQKDLGKARARYRYDASRADEVNVYEGEEVVVLNTDDPEWTYIRNKKHLEGFVPANHLDTFRQKIASAPSTESEHRLVIEDFDGRHALDISVEQGEWVIVISNDVGLLFAPV